MAAQATFETVRSVGDSIHDEAELCLRVVRRETIADGVVSLDLRLPSGEDLPAWAPGSHIDLILSPELTRQYSLCGDPADRGVWRVGVLRDANGRGGSAHVHDALDEGDCVEVRGPRNHFPLEPSPRYLFIAGGIGITPIVPMMRAARAAGADVELHYGGRTATSMAFATQLGEEFGAAVALRPQDELGLLDLAGLLTVPRRDTLVYCCGPEPLLAAVEQHCAAWPEGALHVERFSPRPQGDPVWDDAFEVELARSEVTVAVPPGVSILEAVKSAGIDVVSSCEEGTCGTCETRVLSGEVDHRDSLLSPAERAANDTMFICVSRAAGARLVLDL